MVSVEVRVDQAAPAAVEDRWVARGVREELWDLVEALAEPEASREAKMDLAAAAALGVQQAKAEPEEERAALEALPFETRIIVSSSKHGNSRVRMSISKRCNMG